MKDFERQAHVVTSVFPKYPLISHLLRLFFSSENSSQGRSIVIWNQGGAGEVNWTTVKMEKSILVRGCLELEGSQWHGQLWSSGELAFPVCSQAELRLR